MILLSALMVASLYSCGNTAENSGGGSVSSEATEAAESETTEAETDYYQTLPQKDYSGTTFNIVGKDSKNFPGDAENGEVVNDAVYSRNKNVESKYNIAFSYIKLGSGGDIAAAVENSVLAGDSSYDMIMASGLTCGSPLVNKGLLYNINDLPNIDLEQSWWNQRCISDLTIESNLYYVTGDIMYEHYLSTAAILYNKTLAESLGMPELYELVMDGTWTFDKMDEYANLVTPGSGIIQYGLGDISGYNFYYAAGLRITYFDKNGNPYFESSPTQKMSDVIDKYSAIFADTTKCINTTYNWYYSLEADAPGDVFGNGNMLFYCGISGWLLDFRDSNINFGVIPYPKYDESQDEYYSYSNPWMSAFVFYPKLLKDADMSGLITEALAYESSSVLKPVMYDNMLKIVRC